MSEHHIAAQEFVEHEYREFYGALAVACAEHRDSDRAFLGGESFENLQLPQSRVDLPTPVLNAYDFYNKHCGDYGGARIYKAQIEEQDIYIVRVTTDGDDGWVEIFDGAGQQLAAGRTYIELISWGAVEEVRSYSGTEFPAALDDRQTRTMWDEMVASAQHNTTET
jgi:hypothetical protein